MQEGYWAGMLGTHPCNQLCCYAQRQTKPHELVALNRNTFNDDEKLYAGLVGADAVLHFAESIEVETRILRQAILRLPDVFPILHES